MNVQKKIWAWQPRCPRRPRNETVEFVLKMETNTSAYLQRDLQLFYLIVILSAFTVHKPFFASDSRGNAPTCYAWTRNTKQATPNPLWWQVEGRPPGTKWTPCAARKRVILLLVYMELRDIHTHTKLKHVAVNINLMHCNSCCAVVGPVSGALFTVTNIINTSDYSRLISKSKDSRPLQRQSEESRTILGQFEFCSQKRETSCKSIHSVMMTSLSIVNSVCVYITKFHVY